MSRVIEADLCQQWILPPSLDDLVAANHPARFVYDFVDQLDLAPLGIKMPVRTGPGGLAYSPKLLLRVWLYGWLRRNRSPRRLEQAARSDIALLWLTGLNAPDHNTLWRFWNANKVSMKDVLRQTVRVASRMGLVSMVFHAVDGTKIAPASSSRKALHEEDLRKLLEQLDEQIAQMERDIAQDGDFAAEQEMPEELADTHNRRRQIARQLQACAEHGKKHLLPAEPEVQMIKSGRTAFNYNAQVVADSAAGIIVAQDVVTDVLDKAMLVPMLAQACENLEGRRAAHSAADGGYSSQQQIHEATQAGWEVTVPVGDRGELHNALHSHHFEHDQAADCLVCPVTGQRLARARATKARPGHQEATIYRCPVSASCP